MIPSSNILDEIADKDSFPPVESALTQTQSDSLVNVYQFLAWQIDIWKDPFFLLKKKCPPNHPPNSVYSREIPLRYVCQPFPLSKIKSVSFERSMMSNLILDETWRLLQLLYQTESVNILREWLEYINVVEYKTPLWALLARKIV